MQVIDWILMPILKPIMQFFQTSIFSSAFFSTFYFEHVLGISSSALSALNLIIAGFANLLLILKLLVKLFNVYIAKTDGDASINPFEYLKSYAKGVIVILCFTTVYDWLYPVINELAQQIIAVIGQQNLDLTTIIASGGGLTVFLIAYVVFVCILYIHFLMNGVRMLVLRLSIPFACTGLIDNDNGIFTIYIKKIFQTAATVLVQMILVQLSVLPIMAGIGFTSIMASIAVLSYSLKITSDLTEIFAGSAGGGIGQKASSLSRGIGGAIKYIKK